MDGLLIAIAFLFGLIAQQLRLPPLVGFLLAGFVLGAFGKTGGASLDFLADLGVTLMLFSIGLKLRVRSLLRPEIWAGTSVHAAITVGFVTLLLIGLAALGLPLIQDLSWGTAALIAFALSFSSTVFAVKSLEENGELGSLHGRIAIGVLIMQDLLAVIFLTISSGKVPSFWAIPVLAALLLLRPVMGWMLSRCGHGELITLCGLFFALVAGAQGFDVVGLKADLGALFVGILIGQHPKAKELGKSLGSIIDILLIGFFLNIGLKGLPDFAGLLVAIGLTLLVPLKGALFLALLTRFHLRARTAWMSGLALTTYSEFGLIVMAVGVKKEWIGAEWLTVVAIALALSFLLAAPLNRIAEALYEKFAHRLHPLETSGRHPDDILVPDRGEQVAIFGMGRVGQSAYGSLDRQYPGRVIAFDRDPAAVERHSELGRNVVLADATDADFWTQVRTRANPFELVVLAMPKHTVNLHAAETLQRLNYEGVVAATGKFDDEVRELRSVGVDTAFNLYTEAGTGFAHHISRVFHQQRPDLDSTFRRPTESA
ncbi:MAG: cation:proton antiporter family protein [Chthoniobacterales bacterium]